MKEKKFDKKELMVSIRRNTEPSKCIDIFEQLLSEVDKPISNSVISDVFGFLTRAFEVFHEVDKLEDRKIKSKLLTKEFIGGVYFKKVDKIKQYYINLNYWESDAENSDPVLLENYRKTILLCNYVPAIVKAIIQTKRRSVGLDLNSKRFKNS